MINKDNILIFMESEQGKGQGAAAVQLAKALEEQGFSITLATGNEKIAADSIQRYGCRHTTVYPLPALAADKNNTSIEYSHMNPDTQEAYGEDRALQDARRRALSRLMGTRKFTAIVLESMPFEKQDLVATDVKALLQGNKYHAPVFSLVRDVAITSERQAPDAANFINRHCNGGVIVRGDASLPLDASFPQAGAITQPIFYSGYFCAPVPERNAPSGEVLVAFGGNFGPPDKALLEQLAQARELSHDLLEKPWRILISHNYPDEEFAALKTEMEARGIHVQRNSSEYPHMLANCDLAISAGGYNTTAELLRLQQENGSPAAALLSRMTPLDLREQTPRQEFLARHGITLITEKLEPAALAEKLVASLQNSLSERPSIDFSGAAKAVGFMQEQIHNLTSVQQHTR